jgi:hypothetical protein
LEFTFHNLKSDKVAVDELYIIKRFLSNNLKIKVIWKKSIFGLNTNPSNWVIQTNRITILQIFESFILWVRTRIQRDL